MKFKQPKIILLGLFSLFLLYSCGGGANKEFDVLKEKYNCENVDDCLSKYNFEAARAYMGADESLGNFRYLPRITEAESVYLAKNGEFENATSVIDEANHVNYYDENKQKLKFKIYDMAVNSFLEKGDYDQAKKWAMRSSDLHSTKGWTKDQDGNWSKEETQRAVLLKKIKEYKEVMQK